MQHSKCPLGINFRTKTLTLYDSGTHFRSLEDGVRVALTRDQELSKFLEELIEEQPDDDGATRLAADGENGAVYHGAGDLRGNAHGGGGESSDGEKNAEGDDGTNGGKDVDCTVVEGDLDLSVKVPDGAAEGPRDGQLPLNAEDKQPSRKAQVVPGNRTNVWSTRRMKAPKQDDSCSCGPFAFSFVWHIAHDVKSRV